MKAYVPIVYLRRGVPTKFPVLLAQNLKCAVDEFLLRHREYSLAVPLKGREFYTTVTGQHSVVYTRRVVLMYVGLERK